MAPPSSSSAAAHSTLSLPPLPPPSSLMEPAVANGSSGGMGMGQWSRTVYPATTSFGSHFRYTVWILHWKWDNGPNRLHRPVRPVRPVFPFLLRHPPYPPCNFGLFRAPRNLYYVHHKQNMPYKIIHASHHLLIVAQYQKNDLSQLFPQIS